MKWLYGTIAVVGIGAAVVTAQQPDFVEVPIDRVVTIAGERVEARQVGNKVETTFPWKDARPIKVSYDMGDVTAQERSRGKRNKQVVVETVDFGDGGFKVDVVLNTKPNTNKFCYQIENHEDYDFFYQPPLTQEEIDEGAERPENIIGSYAVYHKTKKNHILGQENYATGKVMHIPRPEVWEVDNKESTREWAELSYTDGELCVTARQEFLDNATYPVRIDPTFGITDEGMTRLGTCETQGTDSSVRVGASFTAPEDGTLSSVSAHLDQDDTTETITTAFAVNVDGGGANSHSQIGLYEDDLTVTTSADWYSINFGGESVTGSSDYVINLTCDEADFANDGGFRRISVDTSGHDDGLFQEVFVEDYAASKEDPWTVTESGSIFYEVSIYATYTAAAESTPVQSEYWFN